MTRHPKLILETDGASRGNPGLAGIGIIIRDADGRTIDTIGRFLGVTTNNQAEYQALIVGLEAAKKLHPDSVTVRSDSELLVKQMTGKYRVRHPEILPLYAKATDLVADLPSVTFEHVLRHHNKGADEVANIAIDSRGRRVALD